MTTLQVLRKARALIKGGWTQGYMREIEGTKVKYCALGALEEARGPYNSSAYHAVVKAAGAMQGELTTWNDSSRRTKAQVLAAFDRAIKACK